MCLNYSNEVRSHPLHQNNRENKKKNNRGHLSGQDDCDRLKQDAEATHQKKEQEVIK